MLVLITAVSILCFMIAFWLVGIVPVAREAIATVRTAMASMRDPALDDLAREKAAQSAALRMIRFSGALILRSLLALAAAAVPIFAADALGLAPAERSLAFMARWDVILVASVAVLALYFALRRLWPA